MLPKLLKHGLLTLICLLLSGLFFTASADSFSQEEVLLEAHEDEFISPVIFEDRRFNSLGVQLKESIPGLMVNFGYGWETVENHDDGFGPEALLFSSPTNQVQFRAENVPPDALTLKLTFLYYNPELADANDSSNLLANSSQEVAQSVRVISRQEWGADESMRYWNPDVTGDGGDGDGAAPVNPCASEAKYASELGIDRVVERSPTGELLTWPLQYMRKLQKIVIHHTDSEIRDVNGDHRMDSRDYKSIVRAIYQYHTVSRGWGDIGYHYIIDPLGNVYEGRYGGDKVIGAHVLCHNNGALGIAVIGNYEDNDVPEPALNALISLVAQKARQYRIDPEGSSSFHGRDIANIVGHKDLRPTACPGKKLYRLIPRIREKAALFMRSGSFREGGLTEDLDYNAEFVGSLPALKLVPNERKKITLRFQNTGKKTWDKNTWLHVAFNNNPNVRVVPLLEDKVFVAANLQESSVAPGRTGRFEVEVEGGYRGGDYSFQVAPVVNGRYKISRAGVYLDFKVTPATFDYAVVKTDLPKGIIFQEQKIAATVDLRNTGNITWKNYGPNQITLGTLAPRDRKSIFIKENPSRLGYLLDSEVEPGQVGHFVMDLSVPPLSNRVVSEKFAPVIEGVSWLEDKGLRFEATIKEPVHLAKITKLNSIANLKPGERKKVSIEVENQGDLPWNYDNMQILLIDQGLQVFKRRLYPTKEIAKGQKETFEFWVQAPYTSGRQSLFLRSQFNGKNIRGGMARYSVNVLPASLRAQVVKQSDRNLNVQPGEEAELSVTFKNLGNVTWYRDGDHNVRLGTARPRDRKSLVYYEGEWDSPFRAARMEEKEVPPGETGTFTFKIKPESKGVRQESFQLVMENVGWIEGAYANWVFRIFGKTLKTSTGTKTSTKTTKTSNTSGTSTSNTSSSSNVKRYYMPPVVKERPFRVRIDYGEEDSTFSATKTYQVTDGAGKALFTASGGDQVQIKRVGNTFRATYKDQVKSADIIRFIPGQNGIMIIDTMERRPAWNKELNDNQFRGTLEVRLVDNDVAIINELPLEDYLKGLAEVSNGDHSQKQKVIAVLARTYARFYMQDANRKFPGKPYDGSDDPAVFQRYLGYGVEKRSPNFSRAVETTEGEVVLYQGKLIKTPYFNQSDGRTRSAREVWGWTDTPYLQSVPDPWCEGLVLRGHGVGLSGCGATAMAKEGKDYKEIIDYYYQGVEVKALKFQ